MEWGATVPRILFKCMIVELARTRWMVLTVEESAASSKTSLYSVAIAAFVGEDVDVDVVVVFFFFITWIVCRDEEGGWRGGGLVAQV